MLKRFYNWRIIAVMVLILTVIPRGVVYADSGCTASISPNSVSTTSVSTFAVSITNNGTTDIQWIDITVPVNFKYNGNYVYTWAGADRGDGTTLTNNTLGQGQSVSFDLGATAGLRTGTDNKWVVQVSDDPGGANPVTCSGNTSVAITGHPAVGSANGVSNVAVTNVTTSSVTITWDSDNATTSYVYYGRTGDYGSTSGYNQNMDTSHSVTLNGLSASTGYHFQVAGDDGQGSFAYSGDNTFLTATPPPASSGGGSTVNPTPGTGVPDGAPTEGIPPTVKLTTAMSKVYKSAPRLEGEASDNTAVARVEYSTDGGKNWSAVDNLTPKTVTTGKGKRAITTTDVKNVAFAFTPVILEDGDYVVLVRATDPSGNQATTAPATLVIDRLPPRFGTSVVRVGPQFVAPDPSGVLVLPAGVDNKMSVSLVGGPTTVNIRAQVAQETGKNFGLTRSPEGLWTGILSFDQAGRYQLTGEAVDGAGNHSSRVLATVEVVPALKVTGSADTLKKAVATLYYLNPETHGWSVWDAATYGQQNPQTLKGGSQISMLVPAGTYFLKLAVPGAPDTLTSSFTLNRPTPLTGVVELGKRAVLKLGPLSVPMPWTQLAAAPVIAGSVKAGGVSVVGSRLPLVSLPTTTGRMVSPVEWYGKPTVAITLPTWAPASAEQLGALGTLSGNTDINVVPLAQQQGPETLAAYLKIAGRTFEGVTDPDGLLSENLNVPGIPVLYFIDRHGIIKKVMVGTRAADEILTTLSRL